MIADLLLVRRITLCCLAPRSHDAADLEVLCRLWSEMEHMRTVCEWSSMSRYTSDSFSQIISTLGGMGSYIIFPPRLWRRSLTSCSVLRVSD